MNEIAVLKIMTHKTNFLEVSNEITLYIIKNSKGKKKAAGMDKISMSIIKQNRENLAPISSYLISITIRSSKFPSNQKIAKVKPLHKKGAKSDPRNYRPISILSMQNL